jgi:intracellular sulfur oxidation DsrE/DsrF family protein
VTFLYLNAETTGRGNRKLGRRLLVAFLEKLAASDVQIDLVGCVNGAVRLTTKSGPALESLEALAAKGARIATCSTCLEHQDLRDKLRIGEAGTMDDAVRVMAVADRVIRPC